MNCQELREHLSPLLEDRLGASERAAAGEHLLACRECRRLRDELRELLDDLHGLGESVQVPEGLAERLAERVPAPERRVHGRTARSVTWQRAAAWALVFFGAWWQLVGTHLGEIAEQQVGPTARAWVEEAKEATDRRRAELLPDGELHLSRPVVQARDSLAAFSRTLHRALFVPESSGEVQPQSRPAAAPSDGESRP